MFELLVVGVTEDIIAINIIVQSSMSDKLLPYDLYAEIDFFAGLHYFRVK